MALYQIYTCNIGPLVEEMKKVLYVTFKQKGLFAGPISAIVTLSGQGGL